MLITSSSSPVSVVLRRTADDIILQSCIQDKAKVKSENEPSDPLGRFLSPDRSILSVRTRHEATVPLRLHTIYYVPFSNVPRRQFLQAKVKTNFYCSYQRIPGSLKS